MRPVSSTSFSIDFREMSEVDADAELLPKNSRKPSRFSPAWLIFSTSPMFAATDTRFAPWYVARSDDKRRARLSIITHLLGQIPYKTLPRKKIKLPKRQKRGDYRDPNQPLRFIKQV